MISNDSEMLIDLWSRIKPHVSTKERLEVADLIVAVFDDYGMADGLKDEEGLDKELTAAVKSRFDFEEDEWKEDSDDDEY
jgi:hypothetical protein